MAMHSAIPSTLPTGSRDRAGGSTSTPGGSTTGEGLAHNVERIVEIEQRDRLALSRSDRVANWFAAFSGRIAFLALHAIWFAVWIGWNARWLALPPFDPYPFGLLTVIVSLEAIFLSTFVLISQNRQALIADRRAKVDLQINLLTEQETTRILAIVTKISEQLNAPVSPEVVESAETLKQPTDIGEVLDTIDMAEREMEPKSAAGPTSAADTDA